MRRCRLIMITNFDFDESKNLPPTKTFEGMLLSSLVS
jgi:hypothetical protein